ncbi:YcxB family protein [Rhizobium sp. C1]|uniref:YcxB family protein n=1 Tax=Rhizobium sp. C1 TaxID=1349799 RepID=UPI001E324EDC|nr:YcxB family protein [Rhizobium sp. C1]MCD2178334.1 YcxB family protein [Rhizobium sp. C1]
MSDTTFEPAALPPVVLYTLTQADYDEMAKAASDRLSRWLYRYAFWPLFLANLGLGALFLQPVLSGERSLEWIDIANLLFAFLMLAGRYVFIPWMRRWTLGRLKLAGRDYRIVFGEDDIELTAGGLSSRVVRSEIGSFTETERHFFFWINRLQAVIVPKRAIDEAGEAAFRTYAATSNWEKR